MACYRHLASGCFCSAPAAFVAGTFSDPLKRVDVDGLTILEKTHEPVFVSFKDDRILPLGSTDKIQTSLMKVQGANAPCVNKAEADQIVVTLRDHNYPCNTFAPPTKATASPAP